MKLRDHPLMTYHGLRNWPPSWIWRGGENNRKLRGEVGVLRDVFLSNVEPRARVFLIIEHEANEYVGCVMFSDGTFCNQIHDLLGQHRGRSIAELGSLEVSHLL
jgi:hypothetical protein